MKVPHSLRSGGIALRAFGARRKQFAALMLASVFALAPSLALAQLTPGNPLPVGSAVGTFTQPQRSSANLLSDTLNPNADWGGVGGAGIAGMATTARFDGAFYPTRFTATLGSGDYLNNTLGVGAPATVYTVSGYFSADAAFGAGVNSPLMQMAILWTGGAPRTDFVTFQPLGCGVTSGNNVSSITNTPFPSVTQAGVGVRICRISFVTFATPALTNAFEIRIYPDAANVGGAIGAVVGGLQVEANNTLSPFIATGYFQGQSGALRSRVFGKAPRATIDSTRPVQVLTTNYLWQSGLDDGTTKRVDVAGKTITLSTPPSTTNANGETITIVNNNAGNTTIASGGPNVFYGTALAGSPVASFTLPIIGTGATAPAATVTMTFDPTLTGYPGGGAWIVTSSSPAAAGGGIAIGGGVIGGTANSVLFIGPGGTVAQDTTGLTYTASPDRLQIGSGAGTTQGLIIGQASNNISGLWSTGLAGPYTSANAALSVDNSGNSSLNAPVGASAGITINGTAKLTISPNVGQGATIAAGTATTAVNALSITQTWNAPGTTMVGVTLTITDTSSGPASMPFQIFGGAGGATNLLSVSKAGSVVAPTAILTGGTTGAAPFGLAFQTGASPAAFWSSGGTNIALQLNGTNNLQAFNNTAFRFASVNVVGWSSGDPTTVATDTAFSRLNPGILALGNGTAADFSGTLKLTTVEGGTTLTLTNAAAGTLTFGANAVTPAASGVRFLCISTTGVVASQAAACVGT